MCRSVAVVLLALAAACHGQTPPAPPAASPAPPAAVAAPAPSAAYPESRREDVVDRVHGVAVADPYRWLEDARRPEVQAWMKAQDGYARAHLAQLSGREALAARLGEVFYVDSVGAPRHRGERYFLTRKHKDKEKGIVYWKASEGSAETVLLDPNTWSADGSTGLHGWTPSWDGKHVAYNVSEHNADETVMKVIEVGTGKILVDTLPGTKF